MLLNIMMVEENMWTKKEIFKRLNKIHKIVKLNIKSRIQTLDFRVVYKNFKKHLSFIKPKNKI